jgi:hypothetical protein
MAAMTVKQTMAMMTTVAAAAGRGRSRGTTAITAATAATMATVAGDSRLLTAQQGDADDREENRESQNQRAIHREPPTEKVPERKGPKKLKHTIALPSDLFHPFVTAANAADFSFNCAFVPGLKTQSCLP